VSVHGQRPRDPRPVRHCRGLGAVGDPELHQDPRDVHACGLRGDEQLLADLAVRAALGQQPQHLELAVGEAELGRRLGIRAL